MINRDFISLSNCILTLLSYTTLLSINFFAVAKVNIMYVCDNLTVQLMDWRTSFFLMNTIFFTYRLLTFITNPTT